MQKLQTFLPNDPSSSPMLTFLPSEFRKSISLYPTSAELSLSLFLNDLYIQESSGNKVLLPSAESLFASVDEKKEISLTTFSYQSPFPNSPTTEKFTIKPPMPAVKALQPSTEFKRKASPPAFSSMKKARLEDSPPVNDGTPMSVLWDQMANKITLELQKRTES
jgi:hypothetical protein